MIQNIRDLLLPLPADVEKLIGAGEIAIAMHRIDGYLQQNDQPLLRGRLLIERQRLLRIPHDYPYTYAEALEMAQKAISGLTKVEFAKCVANGEADFVMRESGMCFFVRFLKSMFKMRPDLAARTAEGPEKPDARLPLFREKLTQKGEVRCRLGVRFSLSLREEAFQPGFVRAHLPVPLGTAQQSDISVRLPDSPGWTLSPGGSMAGTACFEGNLQKNETLSVEYAYTSVIRLFDPDAQPHVLYPDAAPVCAADVAELAPHILFTPYLRALCADVCAGQKTALAKARAIYDFVTTRVRYSFMPEYILLPNIPEFAARSRKGDCGVQTLLFITLCRIAGIPARWQSGVMLSETSGGSHDWAMFYVPDWGWLFADCSFGGSAYRRGDAAMHDFYFGNLDVYRIAATSDFQAPFSPEKRFDRIDPYDNQSGEWESDSRMMQDDELHTDIRVLECRETD